MSSGPEVRGTVAAGFEGVREEFAAVLAEQDADPGAQLAVHHHGRRVVDLWAGEDVTGDTLTSVYSCTKGAAHLVVALLVQEGVLDLDREVAHYWPEFAAEGKGGITLLELLTHRAGLVGVAGGFSPEELADDRLIAARLAGRAPFWQPGEGYGYHAFVIGALTGEVVRRATGRSLQDLFEERIRAPYGLDFHLGLPEELEPRFRTVLPMAAPPGEGSTGREQDPVVRIALNLSGDAPTDLVEFANSRAVRARGQASAGGVANARGLAGMYAAALPATDGRPPLLTPGTLARFAALQTKGVDRITGDVDHFGIGFESYGARYPFLGDDAFGHSGVAGSLALAEPRSGIAYGYTRRRFASPPGGGAPESHRLLTAVLRAAAAC